MAGVREESRLRIALILLGLGTILVLVGVIMAQQHYNRLRAAQEVRPLATRPVQAEATPERGAQAKLIRQVLFMLVVLVGILTISLYALRVWSRRYRRVLMHKPAPPTPSSDVWAMHKLPEGAIDEVPDPPSATESDPEP